MHEELEPGSDARINSVLWERYVKQAQSALSLKNVSEAARMFEIAMQKSLAFGADDWRALETQRLLAMTLVQAKEYQKAETVLANLMLMLYTKCGGSSPEVLEVMRILATVYEHRMMYRDAAKLMQHVMQNHPQRFAQPENADYVAVQRKYHQLAYKTKCIDNEDEPTWLG